jgi:hypothetical protein
MFRRTSRILFLAAAACAVSCSDGAPGSGEQKGGPYLRCAPTRDDGVNESFRLPPLTLERDGYDLEINGTGGGTVVLGLLAGLDEPLPATLSNTAYLLDRFRAAGVQAIAVAGGVGLAEADVERNLTALASAPVPVLVSPGAGESYDALKAVFQRLHKARPQLVDMTTVRRVRIGHVTVLSLPGYSNAFYLEAKERGCAYEAGDLDDVAGLADRDRVNVILSASPPRGAGVGAADRGRGGVNIGDPALSGMLGAKGIRFGLFGHVYEAGGHATLADGATPLGQGVWQDSMYLQTGSAGAVPVQLVDGGRSVGMAQIVEFSGGRARFRTTMIAGNRTALPSPN